jgi:hypothetical protein
MKTLLLLTVLLGGLVGLTGCSCSDHSWYPKDTFIGASGWPSSQVPLGHVPAVESSAGTVPVY